MYCTECGVLNAADPNFCGHCGHRMPKSSRISEEAYNSALPPQEQANALLERAYRKRKDGDDAACIALCREALAAKPGSAAAYALMAQVFEARGDSEQAAQQYEQILILNPDSIADRMKLDDLRRGVQAIPMGTAASTAGPDRAMRTGAVLVGAAGLLALGVALGLQMHNAPAERFTPEASRTQMQPAPHSDPSASTRNNDSRAVTRTQAASAGSSVPLSAPANSMPAYQYLPQSGFTGLAVVPSQAYTMAPARHIAVPRPAARNPAAIPSGTSNGIRVRLRSDDDTGAQGEYVVRVGDKTDPNSSTPKADTEATGQARVEISAPPKPGTSGTGGEFREMLAVADDLKQKEQYTGAIRQLRRALPVAGDQAGDVNRGIAVCYYSMHLKTPAHSLAESARTYYQSAISEYRRLETAGKLTDSGRASLRACEYGLKLCAD